MINNPIIYTVEAQQHVDTFDGHSSHWDGVCNTRKNFRKEVRNYYRQEQNFKCPYCGRLRLDFHGGQWDIDHIIPKSLHPEYLYTPQNLVVTCKDCNTHKSSSNPLVSVLNSNSPYPIDSNNYKIVHPHFDEYELHIKTENSMDGWIHHHVLTEKGRETFSMCNLIRFSEAYSGTSEYIPELNTEVGITDNLSNKVQAWLEEFDKMSTDEANSLLEELVRRQLNKI